MTQEDFRYMLRQAVRKSTAAVLLLPMKATGFRFSKHYRWGSTLRHRAIYALVDTIQANIWAGIDPL